jgi:hypothetical protein
MDVPLITDEYIIVVWHLAFCTPNDWESLVEYFVYTVRGRASAFLRWAGI